MSTRFLFEFIVFSAIAALAVGVVFILALALGSSFDIRPSQAAAIAIIAVLFWFPAFANVHIAVAGKGGELRRGRICAAVRAFGMLLASAAVGAGFLFRGFGIQVAAPVFLAGMILNFGTIPFEK
jgi:hypothetical protein